MGSSTADESPVVQSSGLSADNGRKLPEIRLSRRWEWASRQAISFLMQQGVENPDVISLAAGLVDPATLPVSETLSAGRELLSDPGSGQRALQYGTTAGIARLRQQLASYLARLEATAPQSAGTTAEIDPAQIVVTTGSQQLLSIVSEILFDPGDICLVAAPTYFVYLGVLAGVGARAVPVDTDENGMRMDALEQTLAELDEAGQLGRVRMIYVVSSYENPSGVSLSASRREQLVEIAKRWSREQRLLVLEDAAYRELRYDGPHLPSVWGFDQDRSTVILAQTFSKSYSPGLRVGFGVLPHDLVPAFCDRKGNEDFGSSAFTQHLLATVLENGAYDSHVEQVRVAYRAKRDAMLEAARQHLAPLPGVHWLAPQGGLYVWLTVPEDMPTGFDSPLFRHAVHETGVMYVPGELFYAGPEEQRPTNQMRLSYGVETAESIREGIARLARSIREVQS